MAEADPRYQFAATAKECELFRTIRNFEQSLSAVEQTKLNQILEMTITDGNGHVVGSTEIDARDLVWEFVQAALGFHEELIHDEFRQPNELIEVDEDVRSNDRDSVLGSQPQVTSDDVSNEAIDDGIISWDAIRDSVIPPCVKGVKFTVSKDDLTPGFQEQMQAQFPGVIIVTDGTNVQEGELQEKIVRGKPKGIKRIIIELDESEVAQDPKLDSAIREKFPWALIDSKPGPNMSRKRSRRETGNDTTLQKVDPIKHLEDFAEYASEPLLDDEFGYKYSITEDWDKLSYPKRLEIAHARAIQHQHGKPAEGPGCSRCVEQDYQCKIYLPQLANLSHITFGHSCQNCRLQGMSCDLPAATRDRHLQTPIARPTGLTLDTRNLSVNSPIEDETPARSTAATPKPSLLSRMTRGDSATSTNSATAFPKTQDENKLLDFETRKSISNNGMMVDDIVRKIGLQFPDREKSLRVIKSIYYSWGVYGTIKSFHVYTPPALQIFYTNMFGLYIVAYAKMDMALAYAALLRIQRQLYHWNQVPNLEIATQAFEFLPYHSPLCQWIAIMYAFWWDSLETGDYKTFVKRKNDEVSLNPVALSKLFYAVACYQSPYIKGLDSPVLKRWCAVHEHPKRSEELCRKTRVEVELTKGKRKEDADASPRTSFKKFKRGGSFGS